MTQLARTPASIRRLFRMVDLAPTPHADILVMGLGLWQVQRGRQLAPHENDIVAHWPAQLRDSSFIARPQPAHPQQTGPDHKRHQDYGFDTIGPRAAALIGGQGTLCAMADRRLAVRLRHLLAMVLERGEAAVVEFSDRGRNFEILGAPVTAGNGDPAIFCTISCDFVQARG
ncbi:hypothetical protein GRI44_00300 [Altererythrobacter confluentis]|uniref:Uncharacterized protein n=1 Tax=Allopontixanthobacter confluentis TaxID=1849021 RepID=A0A6L7GC70_9SPHN|nr:hypothetical protein [Allopontixanthobacter confluentis]MXP13210.1 hypothetical protein [Allopontixanthobacter confluentis]